MKIVKAKFECTNIERHTDQEVVTLKAFNEPLEDTNIRLTDELKLTITDEESFNFFKLENKYTLQIQPEEEE